MAVQKTEVEQRNGDLAICGQPHVREGWRGFVQKPKASEKAQALASDQTKRQNGRKKKERWWG